MASAISVDNFTTFIFKYKRELKEQEDTLVKIEIDIAVIESDEEEQIKHLDNKYNYRNKNISTEIVNFDNVNAFLTGKIFSEDEFKNILKKSMGVLHSIENWTVTMKVKVDYIKSFIENYMSSMDREKETLKPGVPHFPQAILNSRQTKSPFIFATLKSKEKFNCSSCKKVINAGYFLRHIEEYPSGSNQMKLHVYHAMKSCMVERGFQESFLLTAKVVCEEKINIDIIDILEFIGFSAKNMARKDHELPHYSLPSNPDSHHDSDCGSDVSSKHSGSNLVCVANIPEFFYRRIANYSNKNTVCVACKSKIESDAFLTVGSKLNEPVHISKFCVKSVIDTPISAVKCRVFKMLKDHDELRQLLACGFYHINIIGFKPTSSGPKETKMSDAKRKPSGSEFKKRRLNKQTQLQKQSDALQNFLKEGKGSFNAPTTDQHLNNAQHLDTDFPDMDPPLDATVIITELGFDSTHDLKVKPPKPTEYIYRLKNKSDNTKITCLGCSKEIFQDSYLTLGKTMSQPLHIHKNCINSLKGEPEDFNRAQCRVDQLLKSHKELRQLFSCGFLYNNIFGFKPKNTEGKANADKPVINKTVSKQPEPKDNGYIFNTEPFRYERLPCRNTCMGCSGIIKEREMALIHSEIIPESKLKVGVLEPQYYHPTRICLIDRGFTERYLEFVICLVLSIGDDSLRKVKDILVRCGFSSSNLIVDSQDVPQHSKPYQATDKRMPELQLFVGTPSKPGSHCAACGFDITANGPCFIYGSSEAQDDDSSLLHVKGSCLRQHFTEARLATLVCVNNNSMVGLGDEQILGCGVVNIKSRINRRPARDGTNGHRNPLSPSAPRFEVDIAFGVGVKCAGCREPVEVDRYYLRSVGDGAKPREAVHVSTECVRRCGYSAHRLGQCDLVFLVPVPTVCRQQLHDCGFRNFPHGL